VVLVGFSGGAAFAGGLVLGDPARYTGAAILYGTLPFEPAGMDVSPGRLAGLPVFVAQGDQDHVIPAELLTRTWDYLVGDSGAATHTRRDPGGHGLSQETTEELASWIARLTA
jgi:phospholipase/carboxylesterase